MRGLQWERWARASGIGYVVLLVIALLIGGEVPSLTDSREEVVAYFDGDRGRVLTAAVIGGVAWGLFLWFVGAIANALRVAGEGRLAATTVATGATFAGLQLGLLALFAGLAHSVADEADAGVTQALFGLAWSLDVVSTLPAAGFVVAASVGLWRAALVPTWLGWAGVAVAALLLLRTTNWASDGFWSPSGAYTYVAFAAALLWFLVASFLLFSRKPDEATVAATRPL